MLTMKKISKFSNLFRDKSAYQLSVKKAEEELKDLLLLKRRNQIG
jgi:hypothetical protein